MEKKADDYTVIIMAYSAYLCTTTGCVESHGFDFGSAEKCPMFEIGKRFLHDVKRPEIQESIEMFTSMFNLGKGAEDV